MVHRTNSGIPLSPSPDASVSCPGMLRPGDIYTHTYHGVGGKILDEETGKIFQAVKE